MPSQVAVPGQPPPQLVSHRHWPVLLLQLSDGPQLSPQSGSARHRPVALLHSTQVMGWHAPLPPLAHGAQRQSTRRSQAPWVVPPEQTTPQPPPQVGSPWHRPQVPDAVLLSQIWPVGQPPPQLVSQLQLPQVAEPVLLSQTWPAGQPPPQLVSQLHSPVFPSQLSVGPQLSLQSPSTSQRPFWLLQVTQAIGWQAPAPAFAHAAQRQPLMPPQAAALVPPEQSVPQLPPQVESTWQRPQVPDAGALSHVCPAGQPPPQVVSHWH